MFSLYLTLYITLFVLSSFLKLKCVLGIDLYIYQLYNYFMKHITKPWGWYVTLLSFPHIWVKLLFVKSGHRLSMQSHQDRREFWLFLKGKAGATNDGVIFQAKSCGCNIFIPKCAKHRLIGITGAYILELAWGKPREEDIIRYDDDYDRTTK